MPKVKKSSRLAEKRKKETLATTDTGAQSSSSSTSIANEQSLQNEGTTSQNGALDIPDMVPSF